MYDVALKTVSSEWHPLSMKKQKQKHPHNWFGLTSVATDWADAFDSAVQLGTTVVLGVCLIMQHTW